MMRGFSRSIQHCHAARRRTHFQRSLAHAAAPTPVLDYTYAHERLEDLPRDVGWDIFAYQRTFQYLHKNERHKLPGEAVLSMIMRETTERLRYAYSPDPGGSYSALQTHASGDDIDVPSSRTPHHSIGLFGLELQPFWLCHVPDLDPSVL